MCYNLTVTMEAKRAENLIKNAAAMLSFCGLTVSVKNKADALSCLTADRDLIKPAQTKAQNGRLFFRTLQCMQTQLACCDTAALCKLHLKLYEGVYSDAGKLRTAPAELDGSSFTDSSLIAGSLKRLLAKMDELGSSPDVSKEDFALTLTYYFSELFLLCPFSSGGLLTQTLFFYLFAQSKGFYANFHKCGPNDFIQALKATFFTDETSKLFVCFSDIISYYVSEERQPQPEIKIMNATVVKRELKRENVIKPLTRAAKAGDNAKRAKPQPLKAEKRVKPARAAAKVIRGAKPEKPAKKSAAKPASEAARRASAIKAESKPKDIKAKEVKRGAAKKTESKGQAAIIKDEFKKTADVKNNFTAAETAAAADNPAFTNSVKSDKCGITTDAAPNREPDTIINSGNALNTKTSLNSETKNDFNGAFDSQRHPLPQTPSVANGGVPDSPVSADSQNAQSTAASQNSSALAVQNAPNITADDAADLKTEVNSPASQAAALPDIAALPSSVLKKAAKLKQKIETLQKQLEDLLSPYSAKK